MTDDQVDAIFRDFKAAVDRETVAAFDRLRALVSVEVQPDDSLPNDLVGPGRIVKKFGISRQHLYRLCGKHPISEGGFAFLCQLAGLVPGTGGVSPVAGAT